MALTRDFKATVQARVQADPAFREALLREGIEAMLSGDVDTGKAILRDYIKAPSGLKNSAHVSAHPERASSACSVQQAIRRRGIFSQYWSSCGNMQG